MGFVTENWPIISAVLVIIFLAGGWFVTFKNKASRRDVYTIAGEEINKHKKDCPYYPVKDASKLEQCVDDLEKSFNNFKVYDFSRIENKIDKLIFSLSKK